MKKYFLHENDENQGPFTLEELKNKNVSKETMIWFEGLDNWKTAKEINELNVLFVSIPPPLIKNPPHLKTEQQISNKIEVESNSKPLDNKKLFKIAISVVSVVVVVVISYFSYSFYVKKQEEAKYEAQRQLDNERERANQKSSNVDEINNLLDEMSKETPKNNIVTDNSANVEQIKQNIRNSWTSYISVSRSSFLYQEIGGISDLYITVTNNTDYLIEYADANVTYLKANGGAFKTETVYFSNIAPHNKMTVKAPNSNRGVKVDYYLNSIKSNGLNFCFSRYNSSSSPDPFKCR